MKYQPTDKYDEKGFAPPVPEGEYTITLKEIQDTDRDDNPLEDKDGFAIERFIFNIEGYPENNVVEQVCFDEAHSYANAKLGKWKQYMIAIGFNPAVGGDTNDLIGLSCRAKITVSKPNKDGKQYNNISEYKPMEKTSVQKPKDEKLPF
jgi:hypothetical protein